MAKHRSPQAAYRIDFALITIAGNLTRYMNLRPEVEKDLEVEARWFPIRTWVEGDWLSWLPSSVRVRARHALDSWRLFLSRADVVVIHAFETYYLYVLWLRLLRRKTIVVNAPDAALPGDNRVARWLRSRAVARTELFVPFSTWAAEAIGQQNPSISPEQLRPIHPGINLGDWPMRAHHSRSSHFRLLFVGGDALRKGIDTLLDALELGLSDWCSLDVVTQEGSLPAVVRERLNRAPGVSLHLGLSPMGSEIRTLYETADALVLPTNLDYSPWVILEAMATGVPVIATDIAGIPEMVTDGLTGILISPRDPSGLAAAIRRLEGDPDLCQGLASRARQRVEERFDAAQNTVELLSLIKSAVRSQRASLGDSALVLG